MATSTVPAATSALVALATAALPGVEVFDGPPATDLPANYLIVGYAGDDTPGVQGQQLVEGGGLVEELYTIACQLSVYAGDSAFPALRQTAADLLAAFTQALAGNDTLGRTVGLAEVADFSWLQEQVTNGAVVTVNFTVACSLNQGKT